MKEALPCFKAVICFYNGKTCQSFAALISRQGRSTLLHTLMKVSIVAFLSLSPLLLIGPLKDGGGRQGPSFTLGNFPPSYKLSSATQ